MYINVRHNKYLAAFLCPCIMLRVARSGACLRRLGGHRLGGTQVLNSFGSLGVKSCPSEMLS